MQHPMSAGGPIASRTSERITDASALEALAPAWDALAGISPGAHVFQSYPWLATWLRHRPDGAPAVLIARRGAQLTAALPLCAHDVGWGPFRLRTLRFAAEDADFADALWDPEHPEDLAALWIELLSSRDWHLIDLRNVPEDAYLTTLAQAAAGPLQVQVQRMDAEPYLDITVDWRESVPKSQRPKLLRRRRQLQDKGTVAFDVADSSAEVDTMLGQFAALHVARWQARGETSVFRFATYRAWLRDLCRDLLRRGQLYLCRLALNDDPVGMGLYFLSGRRLVNHLFAFSEAYKQYGPVHLLVMAVIEDARSRGLADVHDFGRGDEEYKLRWTRQAQGLDRLLIARPSLPGLAAFRWSATAKPWLWRHSRLHAVARELRRRWALHRAA